MKKAAAVFVTIVAIFALTSCAKKYHKAEEDVKKPVNCATAEADLRVLQSEKTHVAQQIAAGVSAIVPIGLVAGLVTDTEGTKLHVATGEYNKMLDQKIAEIKRECNIK